MCLTPKSNVDRALVLQRNLILGLSVAQLSQLWQLRLGQSCDNKPVSMPKEALILSGEYEFEYHFIEYEYECKKCEARRLSTVWRQWLRT